MSTPNLLTHCHVYTTFTHLPLCTVVKTLLCICICGAPGRIRTRDRLLRRQLLYPLSYWGMCRAIHING